MILKELIREIYLYHRFTVYYLIIFLVSISLQSLVSRKLCGKLFRGTFLAARIISLIVGSMLMLSFSTEDSEFVHFVDGTHILFPILKEIGILVLAEFFVYSLCFFCGLKSTFIKTKGLIHRNRFSLLIAFILVFQVFQSGVGLFENKVSDWSGAWYGMDYSLGFGSRLLVGTILKLLFPEFLTDENATIFIFVAMLLIAILLAVMLAKLIESVHEKDGIIFIILLYLLTYGNLNYVGQIAVRFEMIGLLFLLCAIIAFFSVRNLPIRFALVTTFSCLMLLAHQGNFFLDYPVIIIITFMSAYNENKLRFDKIQGLFAVGSLMLVFGLFVYLQFFGTKAIALDQAALEAYIQSRTDIQYSPEALTYEYYSTLSNTYDSINKYFLSNTSDAELPVIQLVLQGVLLTPILWIWFDFWKNGWCYYSKKLKNRGGNSIKRLFLNPILYVVLCFMMVIPEFVLNVDWGRWVRVVFIAQFAAIFAMIYLRKEWALEFLKITETKLKEHKILSCFLLVYLGIIGGFTSRAKYRDADNMIMYFKQYILDIK